MKQFQGLKKAMYGAAPTRNGLFMLGVGLVIADMLRTFQGAEEAAARLLQGHGFTMADFDVCDDYDRRKIRRLYKTSPLLKGLLK